MKTGSQYLIHVALPAFWGSHIQILVRLSYSHFQGQASGSICSVCFFIPGSHKLYLLKGAPETYHRSRDSRIRNSIGQTEIARPVKGDARYSQDQLFF